MQFVDWKLHLVYLAPAPFDDYDTIFSNIKVVSLNSLKNIIYVLYREPYNACYFFHIFHIFYMNKLCYNNKSDCNNYKVKKSIE